MVTMKDQDTEAMVTLVCEFVGVTDTHGPGDGYTTNNHMGWDQEEIYRDQATSIHGQAGDCPT